MNRVLAVLSLLALAGAPAAADTAAGPTGRAPKPVVDVSKIPDHLIFGEKVLPPSAFTPVGDGISNIIYVNRCVGGCTITIASVDDARTQQSTIPTGTNGTQVTVPEFAWDDATWQTLMTCVKEVYSPYNVTVTDVDPGPTVIHHEVITAGTPADVGLPSNYGGVAPVAGDCQPKNNNISYAFANYYPPNQVLELCATVAQESAHSWGLDHEFDCTDPMTYLSGCGEKFFRNHAFACGEYAARICRCGGSYQNSHQMILSVFGPGQSTVPPPTTGIELPNDGDTVTNGFAVFADASSQRGIAKLELWLNGYLWNTVTPSDIHAAGPFTLQAPNNVPDGVIDVEVRAYDDLDAMGSTKITVTKGAPCTSADTCLTGQKCDAGKCFWDPPSAELGDTCTFDQQCKSGTCQGNGSDMVCTQSCFVAVDGECPTGFTCQSDGSTTGFCYADTGGGGGGCCSVGNDGATAALANLALAGMVFGFAFRRRRRRG